MNILLVEDDTRISEFVEKGLKELGFKVTHALNGEKARELVSENVYDVIILDIMLPGINGIQLTELIRFKKNKTPILAVSALSDLEDKVAALDKGVDDYLSKPFHFKELLSRINALVRRAKFNSEPEKNIISHKYLEINLDTYSVKKEGKEVELSPKEFNLLVYLLENTNKAISRSEILTRVWGINFDNQTNVVDVYISYLRNKLDLNQAESLISTVKGVGYMIKA
jgi:two-component system OmpR family response regulator